ncbi:MAG: sugar ABC transporter substrate-binding protein, partial [Mesorhizobium sp.]
VVLVDNGIPDWKGQTALVSTNNLNGGKIAGEYLKTVLKSGDKIGILQGVPGVPALDDRVTGMMEGLGDVKVDV